MRTLLLGIAIMIASASAVRAQTLPFYNADELVKKCIETAPERAAEAASKYNSPGELSSFLKINEAVCKTLLMMEQQSRDELAKNWNALDSIIRLQCIADRSVDSYYGLDRKSTRLNS